MDNHEERLAVIFKSSKDNQDYNFETVALVDYSMDKGTFTVMNGDFEKSNERAFNRITGEEEFIYGNLNEMKVEDDNSSYSIYIFNNDFIEQVEKEKEIDKVNAYVYIGKKLSKIKLKEKESILIPEGSIISVRNSDNETDIGAMDICQMLYGNLEEERVQLYNRDGEPIEEQEDEEKAEKEEQEDEEVVKLSIGDVIKEISSKIVGQDEVIKTLVTNIYFNQVLIDTMIETENFDLAELDGRKVSILLDGATGTGKTAILKEISNKLSLPMEIVNANSFSETGYVGPTITDILANLFLQAEGDLELAERGIVVLDEIDKIASNYNYGSKDMKKGVQEELLSFISGGLYDVKIDAINAVIPFDTSYLTFIMSGAFTGIRDKKINESKKRSIGFSDTEKSVKAGSYEVSVQDYIDYGLLREFFGRIKVITSTKSYSKEDLKNILLTSKVSPLANFLKTAEMFGYSKVNCTEKFIDDLVEEAYNMNTGARGLQTIMAEIQNEMLLDLISEQLDKDSPVVLSEDLLETKKKQRTRKI